MIRPLRVDSRMAAQAFSLYRTLRQGVCSRRADARYIAMFYIAYQFSYLSVKPQVHVVYIIYSHIYSPPARRIFGTYLRICAHIFGTYSCVIARYVHYTYVLRTLSVLNQASCARRTRISMRLCAYIARDRPVLRAYMHTRMRLCQNAPARCVYPVQMRGVLAPIWFMSEAHTCIYCT